MLPVSAPQEIRILNRPIGPDFPPFVIAEMSGNHNQSLENAFAIVDAAAQAGVDAVKLQTYTAATMTLDIAKGDFLIQNEDSLWKGTTLYELYEKAHTPWEWHAPIMERCRKLGLICFSSPFDSTAVDFLEELNVPAYKIASFEIVDIPLIIKVASTGKPLIISTGMATEEEISDAVCAARESGCRQIVLLKCTSSYPSSPRESNLMTIPYLRDRFRLQVGLSDHTLGIGVAVASVALGASVIEKHFILSRAEGGVDAPFSLEPAEMRDLVTECRTAHEALGQVNLSPLGVEESSRQFRRSLYVVEDIPAGGEFTAENLRCIRPGYGLSPKFYFDVIGKRSLRTLSKGTALSKDHIEGFQKKK